MNKPNNDFFYQNLRPDSSIAQFAHLETYVNLPSDWIVIIADIKGSTNAIEAGKYKDVNMLGASIIAAVLNVNREIDIPFIFGGDGATFAIPHSLIKEIRSALLGTKELAVEFEMELRIGMAQVIDFEELGYTFLIKKIKTSENISQASFAGNGWAAVEDAIKDEKSRHIYEVSQKVGENVTANYEGLECKWEGVQSARHHKLAIIVAEKNNVEGEDIRQFLSKLLEIYGSMKACHPLTRNTLQLNTSLQKLHNEIMVRCAGKNNFSKFWYSIKTCTLALIGKHIIFKHNIHTKEIKGENYIHEMIDNADVMKFDGMLKMIIDSTDEKTNALIDYLASQYQKGKLCFGVHRSDAAILTCFVFSLHGKHLHFVDGSDGGYAMAAKQLKQQMKEQNSNAASKKQA